MLPIALLQAVMTTNALPPTEITVYNQGFGLVKEARTLNLKKGRQTAGIEDVAALIDPSSVSIRSLTAPEGLTVLEQNYQYDLIGPASILAKAVGERLTVLNPKGTTISGTLISSPGQNGGGLVLRTDDGQIVLDPQGQITLAKVPEGLITRPTLLWDLESDRDGAQDVELSYITQGLSWTADYVLTLDGKGKGAVQGWVTMNNQSGTTYKNAHLKLLAGDVNQVRQTLARDGAVFAAPRAASAKQFNEETLFEYHLYTLQRPATLANKETKQLGLLSGDAVPVVKRLIVDATRQYGQFTPSEGEIGTGDIAPQVRIDFVNDAKSGLGMPLPTGRFRLYQRDTSGSTQLLGEDQIGHTPKDEKVSLVVGRSFDVRATRKRTSFTRLSQNSVRESFSIELRNRKEVDDTVEVIERLWSDWKVTARSADFTKEDSNTIRFSVPLKAGETKTITYTVETKW